MKGHSAASGKDFSAFLTGGDLGSKEREHCRDAQRSRSAAVGEHREPMVRWSVELGRLRTDIRFVVNGDHSSS